MSVTYKINFFLSPRWTRKNLTDDAIVHQQLYVHLYGQNCNLKSYRYTVKHWETMIKFSTHYFFRTLLIETHILNVRSAKPPRTFICCPEF